MSARRLAVIVTLVVGLSACSSNGSSSPRAMRSNTTVRAAARVAEWTLYGHDLANSRLNPLETAINPNTVAKLRVAWSTKGELGVTGTPIVAGGVVYYDDWTGAVHAVRATTGTQIWASKVGG